MSHRPFFQLAAGVAALASLSFAPLPLQAGGGCGCEGPTSTVYHVHQRCGHHCCRSAPPVGMLMPAPMMAPMMAAPVMAAPVMAMPTQMMVAAPTQAMTFAQAPVMPQQATLQLSLTQSPTTQSAPTNCGGDLAKALQMAIQNAQAAPSGQAAPTRNEEQLTELERRVARLEQDTQDIQTKAQSILELLREIKNK